MKLPNCLLLLFLGATLHSCGENAAKKKEAFSIIFLNEIEEYQLGDTLKLEIKSLTDKTADSAAYFLHGKKISETKGNEPLALLLSDEKLGKNL